MKSDIVRFSREALPKGETDWRRVDAMTEGEIEAAALADPDAQPTDEAFWADAKLVLPKSMERISLIVDREVVDWFRRQGEGCSSRINAVLRAHMEQQQREQQNRR